MKNQQAASSQNTAKNAPNSNKSSKPTDASSASAHAAQPIAPEPVVKYSDTNEVPRPSNDKYLFAKMSTVYSFSVSGNSLSLLISDVTLR